MPTSDPKDPGQVWVFLSRPCLSGEAQPCLSLPHLSISGEEQLWDSGYHSAFSSGATVLPGGRCSAAATWRDWTSNVHRVLRLPPPWTIMQQILWEGALQTGLHSDSSVCDETNVYKDGLLSCLPGQDRELGPLVPFLSLAGRWPRAEE